MTTVDDLTKLPPKLEKLRDMILFVLTAKEDHTVTDLHGRVTRTLTRMCGIPDTATTRGNVTTVLRYMEAEELINRSTNAGGRGTYEVRLLQTLSPGRMDEIKAKLVSYQALFKPPKASDTPNSSTVKPLGIEQLKANCRRAYAMLQFVASSAPRDERGYVVLSGAAVLRSANIGNAETCKPVRYYLRKLGLARAVNACKDGTSLWWWEVSTNELDLHALEELAAGDDSYERYLERRGSRSRRSKEDEYAEKNGPVTVRTIGDNTSAQVEAGSDAPQPAEASTINPNGDPITELLRIITKLEGQVSDRDRVIEELRKEIAGLRNSRDAIDETVRQVMARHSGS